MIAYQLQKYHKKYVWIILICFIFCTTFNSKAQNIIYKKDGTHFTTYKLIHVNNAFSYVLPNDSSNVNRYISINAIDSIHYENGIIEVFPIIYSTDKNEIKRTKILKNSVGLNIWPLFYSKINFYYERLFLENKLGFKNCILFNTKSNVTDYNTLNQFAKFYYCGGLNYYFLRSYNYSMGLGGSFVTGNFYRGYYNPYSYEYEQKYIKQSGVFLNTSFSYILEQRVQFSLVLEIPLGFPELHHPVFLETEISFNF